MQYDVTFTLARIAGQLDAINLCSDDPWARRVARECADSLEALRRAFYESGDHLLHVGKEDD